MSDEYTSKRYETMSLRNRKKYSFKSVGELSTTIKSIEDSLIPVQNPPIGIKTPILKGTDNLFDMHRNFGDQIADDLRNLIQTNYGERLGLYDFGANLKPLVFEFGDPAFDEEAIRRIKREVSKYMKFVQLETFESFIEHYDNKEVAKSGIRITYKIPRLEKKIRTLEIMLYIGG